MLNLIMKKKMKINTIKEGYGERKLKVVKKKNILGRVNR